MSPSIRMKLSSYLVLNANPKPTSQKHKAPTHASNKFLIRMFLEFLLRTMPFSSRANPSCINKMKAVATMTRSSLIASSGELMWLSGSKFSTLYNSCTRFNVFTDPIFPSFILLNTKIINRRVQVYRLDLLRNYSVSS